ncbi:MAG: endonuclease III, partial [Planctomycetota bacterium]
VVRHHGAQVPLAHAALAELPGLGPWRADRLLAEYTGRPAPLIDQDVARVVRRLGWVATNAHLPAIRAALARRCLRATWIQRSLQLRAVGRGPCRPQRPRCRRCVLAAVCPSATV